MNLSGLYIGVVENANDPERLGRLKVRVPAVYGVVGGVVGAVPVDALPWALPMGLPNGLTNDSGGADWLPLVGDQVGVQFLDEEPEKPVWSWLMQTVDSASKFKLHQYDESTGKVGAPNRGAWTRYGHTVEWNAGSLVATTSGGYRLFLLDSSSLGDDGRVTLSTSSGQYIEFDDGTSSGTVNTLEDFYMQIGSELNIHASNMRLQTVNDIKVICGTDANIDITNNLNLTVDGDGSLDITGDLELSCQTAKISSDQNISLFYTTALVFGDGATSPFVLGDQLALFLDALLLWLSTHVHTSSDPGSPTSPPLVPPQGVVQPQVSELLSQTIVGM